MKPHQRKNKAGRPEKPTALEDPNYVFFFLPNEQPNGVFCQWRMNAFTVPYASLRWLKTAHPKHSSVTVPPSSEEGTPDFNCSEQFMMHAKALFFGDDASARIIMASNEPKAQKAQGKKVAGWDGYLWSEVRERMVFEGNWWKFTGNQAFRNVLLGTGEKTLVEAAGRDWV